MLRRTASGWGPSYWQRPAQVSHQSRDRSILASAQRPRGGDGRGVAALGGQREIADLPLPQPLGPPDPPAVRIGRQGDFALQDEHLRPGLESEAELPAVLEVGPPLAEERAGVAADLDLHLARQALHSAKDLVLDPDLAPPHVHVGHRHAVGQPEDPLGGAEGGLQEVGPADIAPGDREAPARADEETATSLPVEEGGEDRRAVEAGETEPVERAGLGDQGRRPAVADQGVVADRRIALAVLPGGLHHVASRLQQGSDQRQVRTMVVG